MRLGILTQWFEPEPGPAALPGALARGLVARGHDVEVVTGFPNYPHGVIADGYRMRGRLVEHVGGARVTRVPLYPSHTASARRRLANYGSFAMSAAAAGVPAAFRGLDALWVNYSPVTIGLPMAIQRVRRTPTVVHALDLWPDTMLASGFGDGESRSGRAVVRSLHATCNAMYRSAAKVAYISPGVGEVLAERGVPTDKLAYAPMWANEDLFMPRDEAGSRGFGLGDDEVALVYAGTLGRAQGLEALIRACAELGDLPFTCLIAGSGTEEQALRDLAESVGARRVRFLGRLSESDMPELMAASDLNYVALNDHPLARITMPSKVQGILASGRPVLGSLVGDAADVVVRAGAGWVVAPGDVSALTDRIRAAVNAGRESLRRHGEAGREFYDREFSYTQGVTRIEALLQQASEERR